MIGLILCAGRGSRLKEETKDKPKCMIDIAGKPVLERIADHMNKNDIEKIVVNLHLFPEVVIKHFGQRFLYIYEPEPMGEFSTVGLVKNWFPNEMLCVMNGDTLTDIDILKVGIESVYKDSQKVIVTDGKTHIGTSFYFTEKTMFNIYEFESQCYWQDIGTPEGLKKAREHYE